MEVNLAMINSFNAMDSTVCISNSKFQVIFLELFSCGNRLDAVSFTKSNKEPGYI